MTPRGDLAQRRSLSDLKRLWSFVSRGGAGKGGIFLELFAGVGEVATYLRRKGEAAIAIDLYDQFRLDLTRADVLVFLRKKIKNGHVSGIHFGTPCTSWSTARFGKPGRPGGPVRTTAEPFGVDPNTLTEKDKDVLQNGNATFLATLRLIRTCIQAKIPCTLENPASSIMWHAAPLLRLLNHHAASMSVFDMCAYGALWRKRTKIAGWFVDLSALGEMCHARKGICCFTGNKHIHLRGCYNGNSWTKIAQQYPPRVAAEIAAALRRADLGKQIVFRTYDGWSHCLLSPRSKRVQAWKDDN